MNTTASEPFATNTDTAEIVVIIAICGLVCLWTGVVYMMYRLKDRHPPDPFEGVIIIPATGATQCDSLCDQLDGEMEPE